MSIVYLYLVIEDIYLSYQTSVYVCPIRLYLTHGYVPYDAYLQYAYIVCVHWCDAAYSRYR